MFNEVGGLQLHLWFFAMPSCLDEFEVCHSGAALEERAHGGEGIPCRLEFWAMSSPEPSQPWQRESGAENEGWRPQTPTSRPTRAGSEQAALEPPELERRCFARGLAHAEPVGDCEDQSSCALSLGEAKPYSLVWTADTQMHIADI